MKKQTINLKITVLGDGGIGAKTACIIRFVENYFFDG